MRAVAAQSHRIASYGNMDNVRATSAHRQIPKYNVARRFMASIRLGPSLSRRSKHTAFECGNPLGSGR